jgi:hypothetical protein
MLSGVESLLTSWEVGIGKIICRMKPLTYRSDPLHHLLPRLGFG